MKIFLWNILICVKDVIASEEHEQAMIKNKSVPYIMDTMEPK